MPASPSGWEVRLGRIALQAPILSCIVLVALMHAPYLRHQLHQILNYSLASCSGPIPRYSPVHEALPGDGIDVLAVVEGSNPTLLARYNLESCATLSPTSARRWHARPISCSRRARAAPGKLPAALFPSELPEGADYDKFIETVKTNEIIRGKPLSEDGRRR